MKLNVLCALVAFAGLTHTLSAQSIEARLVLDNDTILSSIGVNYGTNAMLPGAGVTQIGITLVARATTTGTAPNFGVMACGGNGSNKLSLIQHNDTISNATSAAWTSPALSFQRGYMDGTHYGLLSYTDTASGAPANFTALVPPTSIAWTSPTTNATNAMPTVSPYNSQTSGGGSHVNGWIGVPTSGGYPNLNTGVIASVTAQRAMVPNVNGTCPVINYATADQDPNEAGNQSEWVALYHFTFTPRMDVDDADATRDVTVTWDGSMRYAVGYNFISFVNIWAPSPTALFAVPTASVTFTVQP